MQQGWGTYLVIALPIAHVAVALFALVAVALVIVVAAVIDSMDSMCSAHGLLIDSM